MIRVGCAVLSGAVVLAGVVSLQPPSNTSVPVQPPTTTRIGTGAPAQHYPLPAVPAH